MTTRSPARDADQIETEAAVWVSRRLGGRPDAADEDAFARWLAEDQRHATAYGRLAAAWSDPELWTAVAAEAQQAAPARWSRRSLAAGGGLALAAAVGVWGIITLPSADAPYAEDWRTAAGEWRSVDLPDGSVLRLNGRTAASATFSRADRRLNLEEGEILVEVARAEAPFVVRIGDVEARALGTRYNVDRHADFVDVAVLHGVVEVRRGDDRRRVAAGQSVRVGAEIVALNQPAAALAVWTDGWVEANGMPLSVLVAELSRFSSTPIRIEGEALARREVSGRFALAVPDETLATIATVYGAEIVRRPEEILLRAKS